MMLLLKVLVQKKKKKTTSDATLNQLIFQLLVDFELARGIQRINKKLKSF